MLLSALYLIVVHLSARSIRPGQRARAGAQVKLQELSARPGKLTHSQRRPELSPKDVARHAELEQRQGKLIKGREIIAMTRSSHHQSPHVSDQESHSVQIQVV